MTDHTPDDKRRAQAMFESNSTSRKWDDLEEVSKSVWLDRAVAIRLSDVAEGLALVPVEPTGEMIRRGRSVPLPQHSIQENVTYRAMIRAGNRYTEKAPQPVKARG